MNVKTIKIEKNFLNYTEDDFFWLKRETIKKIKEILIWADKNGEKTKVDMLNCYVSFGRTKADKSFNEVLGLIVGKKPIFRIILRRNMNLYGRFSNKIEHGDILEIAVRGIDVGENEYFILVYLKKEKLYELLELYEFKKSPAAFYEDKRDVK
jgi:hypothetical protein